MEVASLSNWRMELLWRWKWLWAEQVYEAGVGTGQIRRACWTYIIQVDIQTHIWRLEVYISIWTSTVIYDVQSHKIRWDHPKINVDKEKKRIKDWALRYINHKISRGWGGTSGGTWQELLSAVQDSREKGVWSQEKTFQGEEVVQCVAGYKRNTWIWQHGGQSGGHLIKVVSL